MRCPSRRPSALLVCALALALAPSLLLPACGDDGPAPLRVEVGSFSVDGPPPPGLRAVHMDPKDGPGASFELVPSDTPGIFDVPGAPEGFYKFEGPEGWWMIQESAVPPELKRGRQPPRVGFGRSHTLYVGAPVPHIRPSMRWAAERSVPGGDPEPVPITIEADAGGYSVVIRFRPEDYRGNLRVFGQLSMGAPPTPEPPGPNAPLAEPIVFSAQENGRPVVRRVRQGASAPLDVVLVPAGEGVEVDGIPARVTLVGLPLALEFSAVCRAGTVRFANVPAVDRLLRVQVGDDAFGHDLGFAQRRRQSTMRVLATGNVPLRTIRVPVADGVEVDLVQVRPGVAVAYGRVAFERVAGAVVFQAPVGPIRVLLRAGASWAQLEGSGDDARETSDAAFEDAVTVSGIVDGASPGTVVRLFRQRGTEAVLADGFELVVRSGGDFEGGLPTGSYLVEVATRGATWRRPAPVLATSPGTRLHLPLEAP